jgi:hypothetical protein
MSAAGWFIVLLALAGANLPFLNQRLFAVVPIPLANQSAGTTRRRAAKKNAWIRIA